MPKICLCLTGKTIERNLAVLEKHRKYIDIAELRADYLCADEHFYIRKFPELAGIPVILTVRKKEDGGQFDGGESSRIMLLSKGLAFAQPDKRCNFAYVDLEEDLDIPSLEEVARAFGTRIIRSFHNLTGTDEKLLQRIKSLSQVGDEIIKAAVMPKNLDDVQKIFAAAKELKGVDKILLGMGDCGSCTRILADKLGSYLTYAAVKDEPDFSLAASGQLDPKELQEFYRFKHINNETAVYGITGFPLLTTSSPAFFNSVFARTERNAVYIRFPSDNIKSFVHLADEINLAGASVTIPHKESLLHYLTTMSDKVLSVGACNTIVRTPKGFSGYNTDTDGFSQSLLNFIGRKDFKGMKVTVIGAGGAARAVAAELFRLKAKTLILNRDPLRAGELADKYNFEFDALDEEGIKRIKKFNNIIIQTTSVGMEPAIEGDPILPYRFTGKEIVMDIIYKPAKTHLLNRASSAGCKILNGFDMLNRQAKCQYKLFFGEEYPEEE
ncbi:MAG: type I 3-dehydroquinate dehydratase [Termitinemataceae bacterium]|nr:MAG: type I 3-dehydroquinate dehydratase [Termitinemataceae bacterium]